MPKIFKITITWSDLLEDSDKLASFSFQQQLKMIKISEIVSQIFLLKEDQGFSEIFPKLFLDLPVGIG
jgi:hypothetical protein